MLKILQLLMIVRSISPELQKSIRNLIDQLATEAKKTPGSADDQAVDLIKGIATIVGLY
jgi:hypothetical protein